MFGSTKQFTIRSIEDVTASTADCPEVETFDGMVDFDPVNLEGWYNIAEAGTELWTTRSFSGNSYAEASAFGTGEDENIFWLITPKIDDPNTIAFDMAQHHWANGSMVSVWASTDFDGSDVANANWVELDANLPQESDGWYDLVASGTIDLTSYTDGVFVGFKYDGGDDDCCSGGFQLDNVLIE